MTIAQRHVDSAGERRGGGGGPGGAGWIHPVPRDAKTPYVLSRAGTPAEAVE